MQYKKWATGLWKFSSNISSEELAQLAEQWAKEDENYLQLYIRQVSKDQNGIGFIYKLPETGDEEEAYAGFFHSMTDQLKRKFGNDLAGWDISREVLIIK